MALPLPSSNIVSACSGVSLPRSTVTDILSPVITGVAGSTESKVNAILGLPLLSGLLSPLNTNVTGLLSTAASGAPITLKVLSNSGTVLGPGDPCYSQSDAITLSNPAGISIGGNQITGLGDNGTVASAGELNSIALGNGALTNATATNSIAFGKSAIVGLGATGGIALGANASTTAANSIAVGANSSASRGALINYTATGLGTLQSSTGEFSVGATGATRQITNVAAGSNGTDAVNVSQLQGVAASVTALDNLAVKYDGGSKTSVTLGGVGGTTITNVKAGTVSAISTDAVNGSQLFATNTNVANNTTAISNNTTSIAINNTAISNLTNNIINGALGTVQYANPLTPLVANGGTPTNDLTLVGAINASVHLHNVANGVVGSGSTDAINGGQLFATNTNVTNNTSAINTLNTNVSNQTTLINNNTTNIANNTTAITNLTNGATGLLKFSNASTPLVPNGGIPSNDMVLAGSTIGAVKLHNVDNGTVSVTSTDAVNGSQLFATNANVTNNTSAITNLNTTVTNQSTQITNNNNAITNLITNVNSGAVGTVQYSNPGTPLVPNGGIPTNDLALVGVIPGTVRLHNLTNGVVAAGSADAVTGDQLFTTNTNVAANNVSIATLNTNVNNQSTQITNNTTAINNNTTAINTNTTNIAVNTTAINALRNDTINGAIGPVLYSDDATPLVANGGTITNDVVLAGLNPGGVQIHNVANGIVSANSTDAVNGSQLFAMSGTLGSLSDLALLYDDSTHLHVTLGGTSSPAVTISNLNAGTISASSTDAVNGSQLFATNTNVTNNTNSINTLNTTVNNQNTTISNISTSVANNTTNISNNTTAISNLSVNIANGGIGPVQYSDASAPDVPNGGIPSQDLTLVGLGAGAVTLHNVANGRIASGSFDAVNGSQLFGMASGLSNVFGNVTYNSTTNSFAANFTYGGNSYSSIQNVFGAIESTLANAPVSGTSSKYFHSSSILTDSAATGQDSTAIGPNAQATGVASIASGRNAQASGDGSVAIGDSATAQNGKAVSIGVANVASGDGAVAIGDPNIATGLGAIALGKDNTATGDGATALGNTNAAIGDGSVAIGFFNNSNGLGASALGNQNAVNGDGSIALGSQNIVAGLGSLALGSNNTVSGDGSLAIGSNVSTTALDTLAIGAWADASMASATAVGNRASANGTHSAAFGTDALAQNTETSAFGDAAIASGLRSTALGSSAVASADYSVAAGESAIVSGYAGSAFGLQSQVTATGGTALGAGAIASHTNSVALGNSAQTQRGGISNYSAFGLGNAQNSQGEIAIGQSISYPDPITGVLSPTGDRQITGLAAGSADTDAVNVSQLRGASSNLGNMFASSLGGGASYNTTSGAVTGPSYTLNGVTYNNVGDALSALATTGGSGGSGGGTDTNAVHYVDASQDHVALAGANGTTVSNVAAGEVSATSTDAVNGAQLHATNQKVDEIEAKVENGSIGAVQYADADTPTTPNGGTKTNDVTLVGATDAPVGLHNVAAGRIATDSTDAINGSQLAALNTAVATARSQATAAMIDSQTVVHYDDESHESVTLGNGTAAVALHNVAAGVTAQDAVNVSQMNAGLNSAVAQANQYTDNKIAAINFDLRTFRKDANAGTAAALAAAGMPQAYEAGKGMLAIGAGSFQGQTAVAVGFSKAFDDGRTVMKIGATYNSRSKVGVSAGIGLQL